MTKTLCDLHDVNYQSWYRDQFSIAFDAYLDITRRVDACVNAALGRDMPDWRMLNMCPACNYKLEGEPRLPASRILAMDGNNSLKRVAGAGVADDRVFSSDYFLSREEVDQFKDEVKRNGRLREQRERSTASPERSDSEGNDDTEDDSAWVTEDAPGDPTDGAGRPTQCTERWKASAAEHEKTALDVYDVTGIFVAACRHGFIAKACQMVQSGELAKYPLAMENKLLNTYGEDQIHGYDIGCDFSKTVAHSSLGPRAKALNLRLIVNAFHGYAHNRLCQIQNHPLYTLGAGIEDLETLERIFSKSNPVARTIRHATNYHWLQAVDLHFKQWDEDRYFELSRFLFNNYKQALKIIREYTPEVELMKQELNLADNDIAGWLDAERKFLQDLKDEPEEQTLKCAYVQALIQRRQADQKWKAVSEQFLATPSHIEPHYATEARETLRIESARRAAQDQLMVAIATVGQLEAKLAIRETWSDTHPEYKKTLHYLRTRDFHRALDKLQQLVVQRLFEMQKANMAGM